MMSIVGNNGMSVFGCHNFLKEVKNAQKLMHLFSQEMDNTDNILHNDAPSTGGKKRAHVTLIDTSTVAKTIAAQMNQNMFAKHTKPVAVVKHLRKHELPETIFA